MPPNTNSNALTQTVSQSNSSDNPPPIIQPPPSPPTPAPTPTPKTTQTQTGYVGGLIVASRHGDEDRRSITAALSGAHPGDLKIKTDADNRTAQAKIIIRGLDGSISSPSATLHLGTGNHGASFFQDDLNFVTGTVNGRATIRNGETRIKARDTSVLLTANQVPGGSYVGTGCTCDFLTFGEWETTITPGRHHHHASASVTQAPWIAGQVATQLPNTQSASFSGGANFGGSGIPATTGSNTMAVNGSFFTGPGAGGGVVGVGGQFSATGPGNSYQASGVFGGAKH